jgi:hypothetical protein
LFSVLKIGFDPGGESLPLLVNLFAINANAVWRYDSKAHGPRLISIT